MREILFRGKTKKSGTWVEGFYAKQGDIDMIMSDFEISGYSNLANVSFDFYRVIPETVGQFTGKQDKHGTYIYVGDIMKRTIHTAYRNGGKAFDIYFVVPDIQEMYGNAIYENDARNSIELWATDFEVIGNKFDNPELMVLTS